MAVNAIPAVNIGGNIVSPTTDGKVKVQTAKGKIKILSQDQFEKQIKKNADNIKAGNDFEIKGDNKAAKITGILGLAAAVTGAIVFRKELGKFFKKAGATISDAVKGKSKNKVKDLFIDKHYLSPETKQLKNSTIAQMYSDDGIKAAETARAKELKAMKDDAKAVFKDYDADKVLNGLKEGKAAKDLGLTAHAPAPKDPKFQSLKDIPLTPHAQALKDAGIRSEAEFAAIKNYAKPNTAATDKLPAWARDKETCQRYATSVEAKIAKLEAAAAEAAKETTEAAAKA